MHSVFSVPLLALSVVAIMMTQSALFEAPSPGSDLQPVAGAEGLIDLSQGVEAISWSARSGHVAYYTVVGWPSQAEDADLGGGKLIERPSDAEAGVIHFGEKPRSVEFVFG